MLIMGIGAIGMTSVFIFTTRQNDFNKANFYKANLDINRPDSSDTQTAPNGFKNFSNTYFKKPYPLAFDTFGFDRHRNLRFAKPKEPNFPNA